MDSIVEITVPLDYFRDIEIFLKKECGGNLIQNNIIKGGIIFSFFRSIYSMFMGLILWSLFGISAYILYKTI